MKKGEAERCETGLTKKESMEPPPSPCMVMTPANKSSASTAHPADRKNNPPTEVNWGESLEFLLC